MKIGIIGLGLIGGSIAKALQYNTEHTVLGTDIDRDVLLKAKLLGAVDEELHEQDLEQCDLLIVALYPQDTLDFVQQNAAKLKKGAIVLDCCGVKRAICAPLMACAKENGFHFLFGERKLLNQAFLKNLFYLLFCQMKGVNTFGVNNLAIV